MAQVSPCISRGARRAPERFDTTLHPLGVFHFRGGRQAPTTRGLIHETPEGRRFILARPAEWAAPPWRLEAWFEWQADLAWSIRRALLGQTPANLAMVIAALDMPGRIVTLHHLLQRLPSRQDEEALDAVEAEVSADFLDCCRIRSQFLLNARVEEGALPKGIVAYRRGRELYFDA